MTYVAVGARTDCHNIVEKFAKLRTLRYHEFTEIWRELKFPCIYYGHGCFEELIEFTEEVLRISKELWLKSEALNEQTGGLYTLYGLYLKQPTDGLVKVRLTPKDYELVEKFHEKVKVGGHHDVNYILSRMHIIGAFRYCISEYTYGVEKCYRLYHEDDRSLGEIKDEPLYIKRLKNEDIFNKLEVAFKQYHKSKCKLESEDSEKPPSLLSYVDSQFGKKIKEQFRTITQVHDDGDDGSSIAQESEMQGEGSSKSKAPDDENSLALNGSTIKLPWWMTPVRNHHMKKSSSDSGSASDSDSDSMNDPDDPDVILKSKQTMSKDRQEALKVALGMSGDEEEEDGNDNENGPSHNSENIYEAGSSRNMPDLF